MSYLSSPHLLRQQPRKFQRQPYSLSHYAKNVFSQFGEDGIIARIFEKITPKTKLAVEFGAWDGKHLSNTFNLVKHHGWRCLMFEAESWKCATLFKTSEEVDGRITPVKGFVRHTGEEGLEARLEKAGYPQEFDLLSIDVDGMDYHIWANMTKYRPRVVVIEFNPSIPADVEFVQAANDNIQQGSSAAAIVALAREKQYALVAVTNCNLFFVHADEYDMCGLEDNSLELLWETQPRGSIFQGYDGFIFNIGMAVLNWQRNIPIKHDQLQVLATFKCPAPPLENIIRLPHPSTFSLEYLKYLQAFDKISTLDAKIKKLEATLDKLVSVQED